MAPCAGKSQNLPPFVQAHRLEDFFAIVQLAGMHHKITVDNVIVSTKLKPVTTNSVELVHTFEDVLLVESSHLTLVGLPFVSGAEVDAMVEEITKDA
jgi:large subunit ribosomal protein L21